MLERLVEQAFCCFLDGYSGYTQIFIAPKNQEKTTFTCPFGTYSFRKMPFDFCNASATFQKCMISMFTTKMRLFRNAFRYEFKISFLNVFRNEILKLKLISYKIEKKFEKMGIFRI